MYTIVDKIKHKYKKTCGLIKEKLLIKKAENIGFSFYSQVYFRLFKTEIWKSIFSAKGKLFGCQVFFKLYLIQNNDRLSK